jgi:uncharacterized protein YbjT (DUF2867 family)
VILVQADLSQPRTLQDAFTGADAVYGVTNFYDGANAADSLDEARQGCAMADMAKETGVKLFIWSTVPSALLRSSAQFDSPRLVENKFTVSQYLKYKKVPHVDLYLGFYMDNWINFGQIAKAALPQYLSHIDVTCGYSATASPNRKLRPSIQKSLGNHQKR